MPTATVKARPITLRDWEVRAILAGQKTQLRRVVDKVIPWATEWFHDKKGMWMPDGPSPTGKGSAAGHWRPCPFGQPGDRLWVRETFRAIEDPGATDDEVRQIHYDEDGESHRIVVDYRADSPTRIRDKLGKPEWKAPVCMPKWASRLDLENTEVRVERLGSISEADAIAEGIRQLSDGSGTWMGREGPGRLVTPWPTAREAFSDVWQSIHGPGSWQPELWVWVVSHRKLDHA